MRTRLLLGVAGFVLWTSTAAAAPLFTITATVTNGGASQTETRSFSSVEDLLDQMETGELETLFPGFNADTDNIDAALNFRGLDARMTYNGGQITLQIPAAGIDEVFGTLAGDRDAAVEELEDFLKGQGDLKDVLTRLQKAMVAKTPIDPVAGNPNSLMSLMTDASWHASTGLGMRTRAPRENPRTVQGRWGVAELSYEQYENNSFEGRTVTLVPLKFGLDFQSGWALTLDLPLHLVEIEDAQTGAGSLGLALRAPLTDHWALTLGGRVGAVGSIDMGSGAALWQATLASNYERSLTDSIRFGIANMGGIIQSIPLEYDEFDVDYDLSNTVMRNGLMLGWDTGVRMWWSELQMAVTVSDTRFFGDELFMDNYQEVGLELKTARDFGRLQYDTVSIGVSYLYGEEDYQGFRVKAALQF